MTVTDEIVAATGLALERFPRLLFGFLFGSAVEGRLRSDSDLDVAVYQASDGYLEIEAAGDLEQEADIQVALERATGRNVDLLLLNRAPASVCSAALLPSPRSPALRARGCATGSCPIPTIPPDSPRCAPASHGASGTLHPMHFGDHLLGRRVVRAGAHPLGADLLLDVVLDVFVLHRPLQGGLGHP